MQASSGKSNFQWSVEVQPRAGGLAVALRPLNSVSIPGEVHQWPGFPAELLSGPREDIPCSERDLLAWLDRIGVLADQRRRIMGLAVAGWSFRIRCSCDRVRQGAVDCSSSNGSRPANRPGCEFGYDRHYTLATDVQGASGYGPYDDLRALRLPAETLPADGSAFRRSVEFPRGGGIGFPSPSYPPDFTRLMTDFQQRMECRMEDSLRGFARRLKQTSRGQIAQFQREVEDLRKQLSATEAKLARVMARASDDILDDI